MGNRFVGQEVYFLAKQLKVGRKVVIDGNEAHHISRVMRHKVGDKISLTDGMGNEYGVILKKIKNKSIEGLVTDLRFMPRETKKWLTLAVPPLKDNNSELLLAKTTELGVKEFLLIKTERTVAKFNENKLPRLEKIVTQALKSSARSLRPEISHPVSFPALLNQFLNYDLVLLAYEGATVRLTQLIKPDAERILLIIGPEGGFTQNEVKLALENGAKLFTLGPRRLKSETAAIAAVSLIMYEYKEI